MSSTSVCRRRMSRPHALVRKRSCCPPTSAVGRARHRRRCRTCRCRHNHGAGTNRTHRLAGVVKLSASARYSLQRRLLGLWAKRCTAVQGAAGREGPAPLQPGRPQAFGCGARVLHAIMRIRSIAVRAFDGSRAECRPGRIGELSPCRYRLVIQNSVCLGLLRVSGIRGQWLW